MSGNRGRLFLSALLASSALTGMGSAYADNAIETVVVTAEKRSEDLQKVPLSIQVFNTKKLEDLHVQSFADYAAYLPSLSFASNAAGGGLNGPGFANVYMRGVASGNDGNHSGSQPSVGMYLDEQPITTIGGSLDIHIYDIARVEALAGPQGTLYGASSEAGTVRIITNKPDPSGFSAAYQVTGNSIDNGGLGGSLEGYVNIPLADNAAIRIVAWDEHQAGFIDNVAGTDKNAGIVDGVRTYPFPDGSIQINNAALRKKDYNDADIYGGRAALKVDLDDNWTITPSFMGQETKSNGSFAYDPTVGDLEVVKFAPEFSNDSWYQAALTIEGKVANLDMTYAAAWMDRKVHSQLDYSDYSYFYDSYYGSYFTNDQGQFINPSQLIKGKDHFTKLSQELRFASPSDQRFRYVFGAFYQRQFHRIEQRYVVDGFTSELSIPGWPDTLWLTEEDRVDTDYAGFGEASFDILPDLTLTAGGRFFGTDNSLKGFFGFSSNFDDLSGSKSGAKYCFAPTSVGNGPCTDLDKDTTDSGFTHKLNLTWHVNDDVMLYGTWSTGFRPGGVNRNAAVTSDPYKPDYLINYEAGWKTSWLDDSLHFNGALFYEKWKNFQFSFLGQNSLTVIANVGNAEIKGVEADLNWRVSDNFTLTGAGTYTDAHLIDKYCKDVTSQTCADGGDAPAGQQLPITPKFKGNATARYSFNVWDDMLAHVQGSLNYQGSSWPDLRTADRTILGKQKAYTVANISAGVERDNWFAELSLQNAFDERAQTYRYSECTASVCGPETYIIPNQPRTVVLQFGQRF